MKLQAIRRDTRNLAIGAAALLLFFLLIPSVAFAAEGSYTVKVDSGYLALRTAPAYESRNEIGQLYTGDVVDVQDSFSNSTYWWVYSSKLNRSGWVNKNYLVSNNGNNQGRYQGDYRVKVDKNYLALRTAPAFERSNEIGQLYNGDTVQLINEGYGQYWWVYSPKYDREGYVNKGYLTSITAPDDSYTVRVSTGYLALRTAPAYSSRNEIGQLYSGDTVRVKDRYNGQYWWVYSPKYDCEGYVNSDYLVR